MHLQIALVLFNFFWCSTLQLDSSLPANISPTAIGHGVNDTCPSSLVLEAQRNATRDETRDILRETVNPQLNNKYGPPCPCGGQGDWTRIAHLDMSDPTQQCPPAWNLITNPVRGCGRTTFFGDSAIFPANNRTYSRVCGSVIAYQKGRPDAFVRSAVARDTDLEGTYIDGVSVTHGGPGSQQHIWTFVAAQSETARPSYRPVTGCPCTRTGSYWPYVIPSFIGNDYFCATGNRGPETNSSTVYTDDPLWDGEGCGPRNSCCKLHGPPWFCRTLPQPTNDDIELRICLDEILSDEDVIVKYLNIYVM